MEQSSIQNEVVYVKHNGKDEPKDQSSIPKDGIQINGNHQSSKEVVVVDITMESDVIIPYLLYHNQLF